MPLVSVVMPSYNHEKFISYAIESVLNQSVTDLELVIVEDDSRDNSKEIINGFKRKDRRVRIIFHEKNKGIARIFNEGIKAAQGKYIAFIDSDDVWAKNKLGEQIKVLENNEDLIVWSEGEIIDEKSNSTGRTFTQIYNALQRKKSGWIFDELLKDNFILGSAFIAAKKNLIKFTFCERLKYLNDWLFYIELAKKYEFYFINTPLVEYRIHGRNTNKDKIGYMFDQIKVRKILISKYRDLMSNRLVSEMHYKIGIKEQQLGHSARAEFYITKALIYDHRNENARYYFTDLLAYRLPFFYMILRKLYMVMGRTYKKYCALTKEF